LLLLLPTQIRLRNIAILAPITCMILVNITYFVNTLVWAGNVRDVAPIWCDISQSLSTPWMVN
jgi:pheromone a factor receptor